MKWINVTEKMPDISNDVFILMTNGDDVCFGFYGFKDNVCKKENDPVGFVDTATWTDGFGYEYFEDDIKFWMPAPTPPCAV